MAGCCVTCGTAHGRKLPALLRCPRPDGAKFGAGLDYLRSVADVKMPSQRRPGLDEPPGSRSVVEEHRSNRLPKDSNGSFEGSMSIVFLSGCLTHSCRGFSQRDQPGGSDRVLTSSLDRPSCSPVER